jgi:GT2 family glycosyltransferase
MDRGRPLSVVIPTRNRPREILRAVSSILADRSGDFPVVVADQSDGNETRDALDRLSTDGRVQYLTSRGGAAAARNDGIAASDGEIVALTDDDCEPASGWARTLAAPFAADPKLAIVFGRVRPAPHDPAAGFVTSYDRAGIRLARGIGEKPSVEGLGACMAIRRSFWQETGGFDERFGLGAPLRAGEESELTLRALAGGWSVLETDSAEVVHHAFRNWENGAASIACYSFGNGAVFGRHLPTRHAPAVLSLVARLGWRFLFGRAESTAFLERRPLRLLRAKSFALGFAAGLAAGPWLGRSSDSPSGSSPVEARPAPAGAGNGEGGHS